MFNLIITDITNKMAVCLVHSTFNKFSFFLFNSGSVCVTLFLNSVDFGQLLSFSVFVFLLNTFGSLETSLLKKPRILILISM